MLEIKKALDYLRAELERVNRVIDVYEAIAEESRQQHRQSIANYGAPTKQKQAPRISPEKIDPGWMLGMH